MIYLSVHCAFFCRHRRMSGLFLPSQRVLANDDVTMTIKTTEDDKYDDDMMMTIE